MATAAATHALGTVVRNVSGVSMFFSFLGKHGKLLAANEQFTHPGDLGHWCASYRLGLGLSRYLAALAARYLVVESTPAVILYDFYSSQPRQLELYNTELGYANPLTGPSPTSTFVDGSD